MLGLRMLLGFSILPLLVFSAELCVVTLSTLRIIFLARGMKVLAPIIGFFEITIWLFAIGQVMQNLNDPGCFLGFAGGFTLGNLFGVIIERWLALGTVIVRIITHKDASALVTDLQAAGYGVTSLDAEGTKGPVKVVLTVVRRKELEPVLGIIRRFDPWAFYSVDELQDIGPGIFQTTKRMRGLLPSFFQPSRRAA
jgi:uncharacterized protein YebE (UPF0316 family)